MTASGVVRGGDGENNDAADERFLTKFTPVIVQEAAARSNAPLVQVEAYWIDKFAKIEQEESDDCPKKSARSNARKRRCVETAYATSYTEDAKNKRLNLRNSRRVFGRLRRNGRKTNREQLCHGLASSKFQGNEKHCNVTNRRGTATRAFISTHVCGRS